MYNTDKQTWAEVCYLDLSKASYLLDIGHLTMAKAGTTIRNIGLLTEYQYRYWLLVSFISLSPVLVAVYLCPCNTNTNH